MHACYKANGVDVYCLIYIAFKTARVEIYCKVTSMCSQCRILVTTKCKL